MCVLVVVIVVKCTSRDDEWGSDERHLMSWQVSRSELIHLVRPFGWGLLPLATPATASGSTDRIPPITW